MFEGWTVAERVARRGEEAPLREFVEVALQRARTPREAAIVRAYFGLDDAPAMTLAAVGAQYGLTRQRVQQIVARWVARVRRSGVVRRQWGALCAGREQTAVWGQIAWKVARQEWEFDQMYH